MRNLLIPLSFLLAGCPVWTKYQPDQICEDSASAVALVKSRCEKLNGKQTDEIRTQFVREVSCDPPVASGDENLDVDYLECISAISEMTCEQVGQKGDDWDLWIEISFVCGTYLHTSMPEDTGL